MKYSLTAGGILVAIAGLLLGKIGFSEACSNEIVEIGFAAPGLLMAWIGRVRQGDVNILGFKKG